MVKKARGAACYKSKYKEEWSSLYPVDPANGNEFAFYCIHFKKNVSCAHQGLADVKQHIQGKLHQKIESTIKETHKISFQTASLSISDAQIRAEVLHTNFIVQHNISFLIADYLVVVLQISPCSERLWPQSIVAILHGHVLLQLGSADFDLLPSLHCRECACAVCLVFSCRAPCR